MALLKAGLHPAASQALQGIGISAARIGQTIGTAPASKGTHAPDGTASGHPYTAAVDLHVRDLSEGQVRALLAKLGDAGLAAWYRNPGHDHWPSTEALHVHAVYAGCEMKKLLRDQVHDYCHGLNGLASHVTYQFANRPQSAVDKVRALFLAHNPAVGLTAGEYVYGEGQTDEAPESHPQDLDKGVSYPIHDGASE